MKNIKLIIALLALFPLLVAAQTFNIRSRFNYPNAVLSSVHVEKDYYWFTGLTVDTIPNPPYYYAQNLMIKMDYAGNVMDLKVEGLANHDYEVWTNTLIKTHDKGFATTGYIKDSVGTNPMLVKYDSLGNIKFTTYFKDSINPAINIGLAMQVIEMSDHGFLLCGDFNLVGAYDVGFFVVRTDSNGVFQWKKIHNTPTQWEDFNYSAGFIRTQKGTYLAGGRKSTDSGLPSSTWFLEMDSLGNSIREYIDTDPNTGDANGLKQTANGGFIHGGGYSIDGGNGFYYSKGHLVKRDSNFNKQWELLLGKEYDDTGFMDVEILKDGSYIAAGQNLASFPEIQPDWEAIVGWIVKVSSSGNVLWDRYYVTLDSTNAPYPAWGHLYDVDIDSSNSIIACGQSQSVFQNNYPQRAWLLRLDSCGCLVPGCQNVGIASPTEIKQVLSLYPNPTADMLYIYFHDAAAQNGDYAFIIRDLQGKEIVPKTALSNSTTYLFSTHALAQGMYVLELWKKGEFVEVQKFVKE